MTILAPCLFYLETSSSIIIFINSLETPALPEIH